MWQHKPVTRRSDVTAAWKVPYRQCKLLTVSICCKFSLSGSVFKWTSAFQCAETIRNLDSILSLATFLYFVIPMTLRNAQ